MGADDLCPACGKRMGDHSLDDLQKCAAGGNGR
jgi:hypothetical protein